MKRIAVFLYGVVCYVMFLGVFVYAVGFIGNFATPTTLDGEPDAPLGVALAVNGVLLGLFALQHSGMARPGFKRWIKQFIPEAAERSTYVLMTNLALIAMFVFWAPMGGAVWNVTHPLGQALLYGVYGAGWLIVLATTFLIDHFDLFGLRQVWLYLRGKPCPPLSFVTPGPYKLIRHPLYIGWFTVFWATPTMSMAHLLFAIGTTGYILGAVILEERDLVAHFGETYASYRRRVPMFIPGLEKLRPAQETGSQDPSY